MDTVANLFFYVVPFLAMIVVLITVHEWGHFYAARTLGITVTHFSIGMGPVLWSHRDRQGCEWQVAAIPVGGFVRFLGDRNASSVAAEDGISGAGATVPATERRKYFALRGPWDRAFVIAAGPAVNLLLGFAILSTLYVANGRTHIAPVVASVVDGGPAYEAGIRAGDTITAVEGQAVASFTEVYGIVAMLPGQQVDVRVDRNGNPMEFDVLAETATASTFGVEQTVGRIGITAPPAENRQVDPLTALATGASDVRNLTQGMLVGLFRIVTGQRPLSEMGGPVKMAEMSGNAAQAGWTTFVFLVAAISINLGVMNLLPLPVLDGGHLVLCAVEGLRRRPINERALRIIQNAGAAVLIALMVGITASDLLSIAGRAMLAAG